MSRQPVRSVTVEFRTVFVTIAFDRAVGGVAVSMHHGRADNKQPVALRGDEAEFVEFIRSALVREIEDQTP